MPHRRLSVAALMLVLLTAVTPKPAVKPAPSTSTKPATGTMAPDSVAHPIAMFLVGLSQDGKTKVTFKASAMGNRFFFEESTGVTVYTYDGNNGYRKETFLSKTTLEKAMKKYAQK